MPDWANMTQEERREYQRAWRARNREKERARKRLERVSDGADAAALQAIRDQRERLSGGA